MQAKASLESFRGEPKGTFQAGTSALAPWQVLAPFKLNLCPLFLGIVPTPQGPAAQPVFL